MGFFLKSKRAGSIPAAIFFVLFFSLLSILGTVFLAVCTGNPVNKVTHSLWSSKTFNIDAGKFFVSKGLETATGDERKLLLQKGPEISATVTGILDNSIFHSEIDKISNTIYTYYSSGSKNNQTVDITPAVHLALLGLESVDPQFSKLKKELDKIKPIKLQPQKNGPNAGKVKSDFKLGISLLLILTLLLLLLYLIFAKSLKGALRVLGITALSDGLFLTILYFVAKAIVNHQASTADESLTREAIPIAAHSLLSPIITLGIPEVIIGAALISTSYVKALKKVEVS
ncbi:MAG: hypothetical protein WDN07_02320 [Actinomycetota bacterium]